MDELVSTGSEHPHMRVPFLLQYQSYQASTGENVVNGSEPVVGALLPVHGTSTVLSTQERQFISNKLVDDCYEGVPLADVRVRHKARVYDSWQIGSNVFGAYRARSKKNAHIVVMYGGHHLPARITRFLSVDCRIGPDAGAAYVTHHFAHVRWFERKTNRGPAGRDSVYYTHHLEAASAVDYVPLNRIVCRFAPAYTDKERNFFSVILLFRDGLF